jgi:hypothetical protein
MNQFEHQKAVLLTRIEAQRMVVGLEIRAARAGFDPLRSLLGLLGVRRDLADAASALVRVVARALRTEAPEPAPGSHTEDRNHGP